MADNPSPNQNPTGLSTALEGKFSDELGRLTGKPNESIEGGARFLKSLDANVDKSTRQYTKEVAKGGIGSVVKGIVIGLIATGLTIALAPFGLIGIAGAAALSLLAGSALVVGTEMYAESKERAAKEKQKAEQQTQEQSLEKGLEKSKEAQLEKSEISKAQDPKDKAHNQGEVKVQEEPKDASKLAIKGEGVIPPESQPEEKKGGAKEFFKRTGRLFGASVGMTIVGLAGLAAAVAIGTLLAPIIGPIGAGIAGVVGGSIAAYGTNIGVSAIAHKANKIMVDKGWLDRPEVAPDQLKEKTEELSKVQEESKNKTQQLDEKDKVIEDQRKELEALKQQLEELKQARGQEKGPEVDTSIKKDELKSEINKEQQAEKPLSDSSKSTENKSTEKDLKTVMQNIRDSEGHNKDDMQDLANLVGEAFKQKRSQSLYEKRSDDGHFASQVKDRGRSGSVRGLE